MITSEYFTEREFNLCTPSGSLQDMDQCFMNDLDKVRKEAGIPLVLNCGHRPPAWDRAKGRSGTGAHTQKPCKAVDIRCNSDKNRFKIIEALMKNGFRRIGIAKTFIHADKSEKHKHEIIWLY